MRKFNSLAKFRRTFGTDPVSQAAVTWNGGASHFSEMKLLQDSNITKFLNRGFFLTDPHSYANRRIGNRTAKSFAETCMLEFSRRSDDNFDLYSLATKCMTQNPVYEGTSSLLLATKNTPIPIKKSDYDYTLPQNYDARNFIDNLYVKHNRGHKIQGSEGQTFLKTISLYFGGNVDAVLLTRTPSQMLVQSSNLIFDKKDLQSDIRIGIHQETVRKQYLAYSHYEDGDVLVLGSKGVWRNLALPQISQIVGRWKTAGEKFGVFNSAMAAEEIVDAAVAAYKHQRKSEKQNPGLDSGGLKWFLENEIGIDNEEILFACGVAEL
jgi:hypothetical protein